MTTQSPIPWRRPIGLFVLMGLMLLAIILGTWLSLRGQRNQALARAAAQLSAIGEMKAGEIKLWRQERMQDADTLSHMQPFEALLNQRSGRHQEAQTEAILQAWLSKQTHYDEARILNPQGMELAAWPTGRPPLPAALLPDLREALDSKQARLVDFLLEPKEQKAHLYLLVPLQGPPRISAPMGLLLLRIDPRRVLYPMIRRWPTSSESAETMLVRKDGDAVLFLNEVRFWSGSALSLRRPLTDPNLPAAMAVLGRQGIVEGHDYRNVPVLADLRPIPGSPWYLVTRMDRTEALADYHRNLRGTLLLALATALAVLAGLTAFWRDRRVTYFRKRLADEAVLRDQGQRLQLATQAGHIGIWDWDITTDRLTWDESMYRLYGLDPNDFGGAYAAWRGTVHPDDLPASEAEVQAALRGDREYSQEFRILKPSGEVRTIKADAQTFRDPEGRPVRMIGTNVDITDRKRLEAVQAFLAQTSSGVQEETFFNALARFLASSLDMDFVCIDRLEGDGLSARTLAVWTDGRFEDNVTYALKDTPCGEVVGKGVCCFPASVAQFFPQDQVLQELRAESYLGVTLFDHQGQPIGLIAVIGRSPLGDSGFAKLTLDQVSARAAAELERLDAISAIRESEGRYRALVEQLTSGVVVHGADTAIQFSNARAAELLGLSEAQLRGKTALDPRWHFLLEDRSPMPLEDYPVNRVLAAGQGFLGEILGLARPDLEEPIWLICNGSPVIGPDGRLSQVVITFTDITEQRRAEEVRRNLELQLQRSQRMESLGSLAGGVAHDINNVLAAITALSSVHLRKAEAASPLHRDMETITKACKRGGDLVKGLLGFAREQLAEELDVDLNAVVLEVTTLLKRTTLQKVRLDMDLAQGLRLIKGDASALNHGLMNLCVNAVDAMPEGGTLTLRTRNEPNNQVLLEVSDSGQGMAPEVLARALDPFFTTKPQGKGTGLGLSMVYGTVKSHRGELELHSEPGRGTQILLRFPGLAPGPDSVKASAPPEAGLPQSALKVLLVDDDELILEAIPSLIELLGHHVTPVSSGVAALALLGADCNPDLVILDMNMPDMDGRETFHQLRQLKPRLPVLLATGRADQAALDLVAGSSNVALLPKPFDLAALQQGLGWAAKSGCTPADRD